MKKILILTIIFLNLGLSARALEIVYPKKNPCTINANSTFFIGSTKPNESLKINDMEVKVSAIGAFAQAVPLEYGANTFVLKSQDGTINFVIERPQPKASNWVAPVLIEYPVLGNFFTKTDNAPLRETPVDSGINRLSHLPKDIQLLVNGEKAGFYRIYLNSKQNGWLAKTNVEQKDSADMSLNPPIKIKKFKVRENRNFCEFEFDLEKKTPFVLQEENGLTLKLFNIKSANKDFCIEDNTLVLKVPKAKLVGYNAYYEGDRFILKVKKLPKINPDKPLHNLTIAVDAGHGGAEAGAIGCCGDKEKDINLSISKYLQAELEKRGARVVMTRDKDVDVSLQDRVKIAEEKDATILLSIHVNAIPDGSDPNKNRGTSVYYYHNQAKSLAEFILNSMTTQLGTQNDKVRQGSLALVRPTSSVSVLIEVAYIINPDDYALLLDKNFQQKCAKAIADGIENYVLN